MPIDEKLTGRVRTALTGKQGVREVKMFGGIGFMLNGNLVACASTRGLLVRVGDAGLAQALERGAKPMVMNGRQMKGFVWIDAAAGTSVVSSWVRRACAFVETLPAKVSETKAAGKKVSKKPPVKRSGAKPSAAQKRSTS
jgi:TfoX/Sxy family transcriptional regulator of competence genes